MTPVHLPLTPGWLFWAQPWVWLLAGLPLLPLLWWYWQQPRWRASVRFPTLTGVRWAAGAWRQRLYLALPTLRTIALAALLIAAAQPQTPNESRRIQVEGIAIQMVLDVSGSMTDTDLSPPGQRLSRLDVVREVFRRFVMGDGNLPGRPNDLVGMIRFARYAESVCPLTLDRDALLKVLDETQIPLDQFGRPREEASMTAIGDGLALAVERLRDLKRTTGSGGQLIIKSRIVILLTDGENNAGLITPEQAGELAATFGIKVYTILAGTGQRVGWTHLPVDDRDLRRIAELTGGKHFVATDANALRAVYSEIDQLERTKTEEQSYVQWRERGMPAVWTAGGALGLFVLLSATLLRKVP